MLLNNKHLEPMEVINLSEDGKYLVYCAYAERVYRYNPRSKEITYFNLDESGAIKIGNFILPTRRDVHDL